MRVFRKVDAMDDRPPLTGADIIKRTPEPAPQRDRKAVLERAEYLMQCYHAPPHVAERVVQGMDRLTETLLAIEMAQARQAAFTADYDPFRRM